jgi:hypothetical protein
VTSCIESEKLAASRAILSSKIPGAVANAMLASVPGIGEPDAGEAPKRLQIDSRIVPVGQAQTLKELLARGTAAVDHSYSLVAVHSLPKDIAQQKIGLVATSVRSRTSGLSLVRVRTTCNPWLSRK